MGKVMVGKVSDVSEDKPYKVSIDGNDILITKIGKDYHAIDDTCTHAGASLSEAKLQGDSIICGWHGAQFNCKNGKLEKFPAKINDLKAYKVIIEVDNILIETEKVP